MSSTITKENNDETKNNDNLFERKSIVLKAIFPFIWIFRWFYFRILGKCWTPQVRAELVMKDFYFGEGPRMHNGFLYFSDMHRKEVIKLNIDTNEIVDRFTFNDLVSGVGFLPDGKMLVVSMEEMKLLVVDEKDKNIKTYADLSKISKYRCNDMVVDTSGRAYVGNFGFDLSKFVTDSGTTTMVRVNTDQSVHVAAKGMFFPNGCVITPDGKTFIVGETFSGILTAFDIDDDGKLSNRRVWADIGIPVDGMCLDAEGCIWVALPQVGIFRTSGCVVRVREGGEILECYGFNCNGLKSCAFACMLGTHANGEHFLYILEGETSYDHGIMHKYKNRNGRLKKIKVAVGPAKHPSCASYNGGYC